MIVIFSVFQQKIRLFFLIHVCYYNKMMCCQDTAIKEFFTGSIVNDDVDHTVENGNIKWYEIHLILRGSVFFTWISSFVTNDTMCNRMYYTVSSVCYWEEFYHFNWTVLNISFIYFKIGAVTI